MLPRSTCSLNIPNLCDNFLKKLVSEIRKCHHLQGTFPLTHDQGLCLWTSLGASLPNPHYIICPPPAEGLDPPLRLFAKNLTMCKVRAERGHGRLLPVPVSVLYS